MRLDNPAEIDQEKVLISIGKGTDVIIQFCGRTYTDKVLRQIDGLCEQSSSNLQIRFYGNESSFDASILLKIPSVKNLNLDYFNRIKNTTSLKQLDSLKYLFLRVGAIDDTSIWSFENMQKLKMLDLEVNKNVIGIFEHIFNYNQLESLALSGKPINVQTVGEAKNLKQVHLWHLPKSSTLEGLNKLPRLKELSLTLGGRENIDELDAANIEVLRLNRVKGFKGFADLSMFTNLQWLDLVDLVQLQTLNFPDLPSLKKLTISNCKNIEQIDGLSNLQALEWLLIDRIAIDFDEFEKVQFPSSLKIFNFYTDKVRRDKEIAQHLKSLGYQVRMEL